MSKPVMLITGTRKGLGRFISEYYLKRGCTVVGCSRSESDLLHENYRHFLCDVSCEKDVKKMVSSVRNEFGRLDILINNAGIASMNHFMMTPTDTAKRVMDTNFFGTFILSRECARILRKSAHPRIVNFSTVAVPLDLAGEAAYAASKAAVESLTKVLAKELQQFMITVNAVGPTPVDTDLIRAVTEDKLNKLTAAQAIKRMGKREDVLNVIEFYLNPASDFITGQIIYLGGVF